MVDGYNVINAWKDVFNLEKELFGDTRDKLLNILSNYQGYKKMEIIVVFDAHMVKGSQEKKESFDNLTVVFTKENQTADNYIERFVYRFGSINTIRVVTSDYLEQTIILSNGGIRMTPRELQEEINCTNRVSSVSFERSRKVNTVMSNVRPEMLEKLEKIRRSKF